MLRLTGSPAQVEAVRGEWARLKQGISTDVLDTNLLKRLRPDLYKSLSIVSDAFVASESKSLKRVQVSYRTRQKAAVGKVEAGLRYLRLQVRFFASISTAPIKLIDLLQQHSTILKSPRFAFLDNQNKDNVYLPIVPQSPLPWDLVALSPMNLTRYTSMSPQGSARSLYRAGWNESETREEDLQSALLDPLTAAKGDLKVKARYVQRNPLCILALLPALILLYLEF